MKREPRTRARARTREGRAVFPSGESYCGGHTCGSLSVVLPLRSCHLFRKIPQQPPARITRRLRADPQDCRAWRNLLCFKTVCWLMGASLTSPLPPVRRSHAHGKSLKPCAKSFWARVNRALCWPKMTRSLRPVAPARPCAPSARPLLGLSLHQQTQRRVLETGGLVVLLV